MLCSQRPAAPSGYPNDPEQQETRPNMASVGSVFVGVYRCYNRGRLILKEAPQLGPSESVLTMDMDMPMTMDLRLRATCQVGPLLFHFWNIQDCGHLVGSCLLITVLCFLRHLFQMHKTRYILSLPTDQPCDGKVSQLAQSCCGTYQSLEEERSRLAPKGGASGKAVNDCNSKKDQNLTRLRINLHTRLLLTLYFSLLGGMSIVVMLLAMTFNVYIIAAILLGEGAGHFYFSTDFYHDLLQSGSFH